MYINIIDLAKGINRAGLLFLIAPIFISSNKINALKIKKILLILSIIFNAFAFILYYLTLK
jgi:hypothetical protein